MKKNQLLTILFALLTTCVFSQTNEYWSAYTGIGKMPIDKAVARLSFPSAFKLFNLNIGPLRLKLMSIADNHAGHSTIISLPNADGNMEQFEVVEASNFEPGLQATFPEIRAFSGKGTTDKYATLKLSISPQGIQTMVFRTDKANEFIEAYSEDHSIYAVFRSQRKPGQLPWVCTTNDQQLITDINAQVNNTNLSARSTGDLKTMRLAQSCNAEYSNYFGATSAADVALVLAAFNATLTRCNGVYEKDLALHLNLIAATTNVIYYVPASDPYTTLANWNAQLQSTLTSVIGEANYDIGHMFGASGGGGNAGCIGCVCTNGSKGSGITSPADGIPQGDNFDIDYVVHEVGHQLGGNHTFSMSSEIGSTVQKEVGSGITIMGYAGITSQDVAPHSIDIYHEATIAQIQANLATKTCPVTTNIAANNATPVVAAVANYTIPISTAFALTGSATDANAGDVLTYCWEQNDNSTTTGANSVASPTKTTGPNFLSFSPTVSPTRYFPVLSTILAGGFVTGPLPGGDANANIEALSSVSRALNFRLTVRDNALYSSTVPVTVGQTQFTDMVVTVSSTSGPFAVSSPNTAVSWVGLTSQAVTWTVNNTTAAPVSCSNVNILLSTDGGITWPVVLAANTPNDGSETVTIPNTATSTARIKVEAVGNIFFDISNSNFTITASAPGFDFDTPVATTVACSGPASAAISLGTVSYFGYTTPVNLSAAGVPPGAGIAFSVNPVIPGNSTVVTLNNTNTLSAGTYNITITGVSGSLTVTRVITYIIQTGTGPSIGTQPGNQTACAGSNAIFSISTSGTVTSHQWQVSTNGGTTFTNVASGGNSPSYIVAAATLLQNNYSYRVIVSGQCNTVTSNPATLNVNALPSVPVITVNNAVICVGDIVTMDAAANGIVTATLGSGTSTSAGSTTATTLGPNPLQNFYGGNKQQMLIRSTELSALGLLNGSVISAIKLNLVTADPAWALQNLVVKMKNTATTTLSAWETGMTTARTAATYTPATGLNTLTLSAPFTWTGNSIVIEINYSNNNAGTSFGIYNTAKYSATSYVSTRFYRVDNATAAAIDAFVGTATASYSQRNDITFDYTTAADITWGPLANLYNEPAASTAYLGTIATTVYAKPILAGTPVYTATAINAQGCTTSTSQQITVNNCGGFTTLNLKLFLEGFYTGASTMRANKFDLGLSADPTAADEITINLWSVANLPDPNPDYTISGLLHTNGTATVQFPGAVNGNSFYIAIKHRNSIETWSKLPVAFTAITAYDFSTGLIKAYDDGINPAMINVGGGIYAIYNGDVNQDGTVDISDAISVQNNANIFAFGYDATDVTGDGATDLSDAIIVQNNSYRFLFFARPY